MVVVTKEAVVGWQGQQQTTGSHLMMALGSGHFAVKKWINELIIIGTVDFEQIISITHIHLFCSF